MGASDQQDAGRKSPESAGPGADFWDRATRFDTLWTAWERVRANRGAAGGDGVTVDRFERQAPSRISRLSHDLRNGRYRPQATRRVAIPKASGSQRPLDIPSVVDRIAQGAVAMVLAPRLEAEFEDASFAYRPGRSVAQAIQRVGSLRRQGFTHLVDADILRYFERVPHDRLLGQLDEITGDTRLVDLIALWLEHHNAAGLGLPQGSPLSPLLANLYLDALDETFTGKGLRIVRFADDFLLLTKSEAKARDAHQALEAFLADIGLELNPDKTRIVSFDKGLRFLGHVLVRSMVFREVLDPTDSDLDPVSSSERTLAETVALATSDGGDAGEASQEPPDERETASRGRWSVRRRTLYLLEPGRHLAADEPHFLVRDGEAELLRLPASRLDRIEVRTGAGIDTAALDLAAATDTEIVRIDGFGRTIGRFSGADPGRARRQLAQAAAVLDSERRSDLAQAIVAGKVFNQRVLLKRLDRRTNLPDLDATFLRMARILRDLERGTHDVASAMGKEGEAAALYWPALARVIDRPWAFSGRRRRRVGLDAFNVVADILSSLLLRDCAASISRTGLHPGYGLLHASEDGEDALSYDLAEEFRAPVVEACAASLFVRNSLERGDFVETANGLRLPADGFARVLRAYEAWMGRAIRDPVSGEKMLWRGLLDEQAWRLAQALDTDAAYRPYRMDY